MVNGRNATIKLSDARTSVVVDAASPLFMGIVFAVHREKERDTTLVAVFSP